MGPFCSEVSADGNTALRSYRSSELQSFQGVSYMVTRIITPWSLRGEVVAFVLDRPWSRKHSLSFLFSIFYPVAAIEPELFP